MVFTFVPTVVIAPIATTEIRDARMAYSIIEAPSISFRNLLKNSRSAIALILSTTTRALLSTALGVTSNMLYRHCQCQHNIFLGRQFIVTICKYDNKTFTKKSAGHDCYSRVRAPPIMHRFCRMELYSFEAVLVCG